MKMSQEDKIKASNMKSLFTNPNTRAGMIISVAVIAGLVGVGLMGLSDTQSGNAEAVAGAASGPNVTRQPGASTSPSHADLQRQANQAALEQARQAGQSAVPTIAGNNSNVNSPLTLPTQAQPLPVPTQAPTVAVPVTSPMQPQPQYMAPSVPTLPAPAAQEVSRKMEEEIQGFLNFWGPQNAAGQEFMFNGEAREEIAAAPVSPSTALNAEDAAAASEIRYVRAGSVINSAYLITPLNSDEPGPVLAEIRSGPLASARLLGTQRLVNEGILIEFHTISRPGWPDSYPVRAVGMNEAFSTSLATDVNRHYIRRYFGLLGGSYLEGYGQALQQQGQETVVNPAGGVVVSQNELDTGQVQRVAQGSVLQQIGSDWTQSSERDVTVKVEGEDGQPYPVRILFLENF